MRAKHLPLDEPVKITYTRLTNISTVGMILFVTGSRTDFSKEFVVSWKPSALDGAGKRCQVGFEFKTVGRTITETDLVNFIGNSGMVEVLFTDTLYAEKHAPKGGRIVPAALLFSIAEGLTIQATLQGTGLAFIHMDLDVKGPTFVGDTIHVEGEVLESRPSSWKSGARSGSNPQPDY